MPNIDAPDSTPATPTSVNVDPIPAGSLAVGDFDTGDQINCEFPLSRAHVTTDILLISIAIAIPFVSWIYIPFGGESHWFARSGTIMAIIGIILESRLFVSKLVMHEFARLSTNKKAGPTLHYAMTKGMALLTHLIVLCGAVISGYGDLLFAEVKLS